MFKYILSGGADIAAPSGREVGVWCGYILIRALVGQPSNNGKSSRGVGNRGAESGSG